MVHRALVHKACSIRLGPDDLLRCEMIHYVRALVHRAVGPHGHWSTGLWSTRPGPHGLVHEAWPR